MGQTQEVTLPHSYPETAHALIRSSIHSLTPGDTTYNHKDRIRTFLYRRRLSAINAHQKGPAKEEKQKCLTRQPASLARSMALEHLKTPKRKRRSPFQVLRLFQQVDEPLIWCGRRESNQSLKPLPYAACKAARKTNVLTTVLKCACWEPAKTP